MERDSSRVFEDRAKPLATLAGEKSAISLHTPNSRKRWCTIFWFTCLSSFLVFLNIVSSTLNSPLAYAAPVPTVHTLAAPPASTVVSGPRVSPDLTPQPLSTGSWNAAQGVTSHPDSSLMPSKKSRKPGEQPDLRTETSQTILNPDGTWTLKAYGAPINYQDAQGNWQPIDPTLIGDSSVAGYAYGNKANKWHVRFAAQAGGPTLVNAQFPGVTSLETLQGAATVPAHVSGSQIEYAGVFPGTDLLYQVGSTTLEEMLLLHNSQGPSSYTFVYHLPGASAQQDASGNVIFTDAKGKVLLVVGGLFMYESDANGQMLSQGLGSQAIKVSLASQGADFAVTLIPDASWLSNPKRHFPVAIDPSQTWTGGNNGQNTTDGNVYASANDESGNPNSSFWNQLGMRIGNCNSTQGTGTSRAYLKFPIGSPPAGAHVTSANLAIFQTSEYGGGLGVTINAAALLNTWSATTLTWNNHPTGFLWAGSGQTASTQLSWVNIDVSDAASEWWQQGVALNGLALLYANESQQCQFFESDSASSNRPVLTINYVQDQTPPTGSVLFNGSSTMGTAALLYSGMDNSTTSSFAYMKAFDLSSQNITIGPNTTLSYWIFPQSSTTFGGLSGNNSTCVALDMIFSDGSALRNAGAVDQHGNQLHPAHQCGQLTLDQWNYVTSNIGAVVSGKVANQLDFGYDQPANTGGYRGFIDDIRLSNPGSSTPLFATGFESSDPQPTWTNTVDTPNNNSAGGITNVGGVCCGLSGPEAFVGVGIGHSSGTSAPFTNTPTVTVQPYSIDPGSLDEWNSNWTSVNGLATASPPNSSPQAHWSVDSSNAELIADTSSCGSNACWAETYFSHTMNINSWPTFTVMFKVDNLSAFQIGLVSADNSSDRFMLTTPFGANSGFNQAQISLPGNLGNVDNISTIPLSVNTWYVAQFSFPLANAGAVTVWQAGQPRPATPTDFFPGMTMSNPGLNIWDNGDNGPNLHHVSIGNVTMTSRDLTNPNIIGSGVSMMSLSSDGNTWGCPAYSGGSTFSNGPWCVYSNQSFPWTFSGPDGKKTLWYQYTDNTGQTVSGSSSIIYDTTPPVVNSISPGNGNEVRGVVTVRVNATDPAASDGSSSGVSSAVLYVDGVQAGSPASGTSTPTFLWDTTNLSQGVHILTAKATDAAGNTGAVGGSTELIVDNTGGASSAIVGGGAAGVSVNVANGDAIVSTTDLSIPGRGPNLSITRTYRALGTQLGFFGRKWSSNLDEALRFPGDGSAIFIDASGGYHVFLPNGSGGYLTSPGLYVTLMKNGDGTYTISARDQSKTNFNTSGQLASVVDRHGNSLTVAYDSNGFPTSVTDASGRSLSITVTNGDITQITDPGGRVYKYVYNSSGYMENFLNPQGIETAYNLHSVPGMLIGFTYNFTSTYPSGDSQTNVSISLIYDSENRLVKVLDPMSYDTDFSYSTVGTASQTIVQRLQGISPATYASTTYLMTTDGMGAVAKVTDALGNVTQAQYDANENVTQVTDPVGRVSTSTYDANGNVLTHIVDPGSSPHLNLTTSTTYDSANNVLTVTNPLGIVTQTTYDNPTAGDPVKVVANYVANGPSNSDTNVTSTMTYDSFGEVLTSTSPLGIVTQTTYDIQGDVLSTVVNYQAGVTPDFQTNVTTSSTYDVLGQRLTATNPRGVVTQYTYDNMGQLIKTVANYQAGVTPDQETNVTTTNGYDALGRQVTVTDPLGIVTQTVYDADGRVTQTVLDYVNGGTKDTQTNVVSATQTYDAAGNVLTATDAKGNVTVTTYDLDNRVLKTTQKDSSGTVLQNGQVVYDPAGQVVERDILDANSAVLLKLDYGFDSAGRATTTVLPPAIPGLQGQAGTSTVSTTTYDAAGEQLEIKTTNAGLLSLSVVNDATVTYDHLGRVLSKTEEANTSSAQTTSFTYDLDGRQTSVTDPSKQVTSSTYDALGAVLTTTHPDGTVDTMTYDVTGELLSTSNSAGTTKDTYDALGRITYDERDDGTGGLQTGINYTYDANGNKLTQFTTIPGGTNTTYRWTYDKLNRAVTMNDGTRSYAYDLNSNVTQMTVAVGSNTIGEDDYTYDGANRLTSLTAKVTAGGATLHTYGYTYDALGDRTQITTDGTATTYDYDNLTQLTSVHQGSSTLVSYSYDANSNRTSMVTSAGTTGYTYDSSDTVLLSKQDPNGKVTNYTYDSNGNLLKATFDPSGANQVTGYVYDKQNRLTEVDQPNGNKVQFTYDADGNRISKTVTTSGTSTTIKDVYAFGHLSEQTDASGNPLATFTYESSGRPASVVLGDPASGPRYYYVYDGHGDVVALTDSSGTVVASYGYDAFGVLLSSSENFPNGWSNPYRFDGADLVRYDSETGLYWMSVRAYDPTLGRFISHDPLGRLAAQGIDFHPYVYTDNNPVNRTDPSGQRWIDGNGDSAWISNGSVYVQTPGSRSKAVAKVPMRTPAPSCNGGGGTHMGAVVCTKATAPTTPTTPTDSCNSACGAYDKALIEHFETQQNLGQRIATDVGYLVGDALSTVASMVAGQWFFAATALAISVVPDLANLARDIGDFLGYTPSWLSGLATTLQQVSTFLSMAQGFLGFAWVLSALANPAMGLFREGAGIAAKEVAAFLFSSGETLASGTTKYAQLLTPDQLDQMAPLQLHYQCLADTIKGCK